MPTAKNEDDHANTHESHATRMVADTSRRDCLPLTLRSLRTAHHCDHLRGGEQQASAVAVRLAAKFIRERGISNSASVTRGEVLLSSIPAPHDVPDNLSVTNKMLRDVSGFDLINERASLVLIERETHAAGLRERYYVAWWQWCRGEPYPQALISVSPSAN
jgi:hypothetical protein